MTGTQSITPSIKYITFSAKGLTLALEGSRTGQPHNLATVFLQEAQVPTESKAGWAPQPVWALRRSLGLERIKNQDHPTHSLVTILPELYQFTDRFITF
jgi:hypothetical protein